MISRLLLPFVLIGLTLAGCASHPESPTDPDLHDADLTAAEQLSRLARAEAQNAPAPPPAGSVAPPGGRASARLVLRDADDQRAWLTLDEAMARLAWNGAVSTEPIDETQVTAEARDEALRKYIRARDEALQGRHLAAVTALEQARELDPASPTILRQLAQSHGAMGATSRALGYCRQLLAIDPNDRWGLLTLALAAGNTGDHPQTAALLSRPYAAGGAFDHDPAADTVALHALHVALAQIGYDAASIEAGLLVLHAEPVDDAEATAYRNHVQGIAQRTADTWRTIGDAHARLGAYSDALDAYSHMLEARESSVVAAIDGLVFAQLALGRPLAAQHTLVVAMRLTAPNIPARLLPLTRYVANHAPDHGLFAAALAELAEQHDHAVNIDLARTLLLDPPAARETIEALFARHPDDPRIVGRLIDILAEDDPDAAIAFIAARVADRPDRAETDIRRLVSALDDPAAVIGSLVLSDTPGAHDIAIRLLAVLSAPERAWGLCAEARNRWPDDPRFLHLALELAGTLDEPALVDDLLTQLDRDDLWGHIIASRALLAVESIEGAHAAATRAMASASTSGVGKLDAKIAIARSKIAELSTLPPGRERDGLVTGMRTLTENILSEAPQCDEPYQLMLSMSASGSSEGEPNLDQLREVSRQLQQRRPDSRLYRRLVARESLLRNRFDAALAIGLDLYGEDPSDVESCRVIVTALDSLGRADDALAWLQDQHADRPADPVILNQLVRLHLNRFVRLQARGDTAEAARNAAQAELKAAQSLIEQRRETLPNAPLAIRLLELTHQVARDGAAEVELGEPRLHARPDGPRRDLELAALYLRGGMDSNAFTALTRLVDHADDASRRHLSGALALTARINIAADDRNELIAALVERIVERWPDSQLAVYSAGAHALAALEGQSVRFEQLIYRAATESLGAEDDSLQGVLPWREMAQSLIDRGNTRAATLALRIRLASLDQIDPAANSVLCSMIIIGDVVTPGGAEKTIELLAERAASARNIPALPGMAGEPTQVEALVSCSGIYTMLGNLEGAETVLRRALELDPEHAMAMNNLGYAQLDAGALDDETVRLIESAHLQTPDEANIVDSLAWLRYHQGRLDEALELFITISGPDQNSPEVFDHLGDTLWRLGRTDEAVEAWSTALDHLGLDSEAAVQERIKRMADFQSQVWGLLVAHPRAVYDRDAKAILERISLKLAMVGQGMDPPIAEPAGGGADDE
jgi:tetratricopeptide (TPR) repeat protein